MTADSPAAPASHGRKVRRYGFACAACKSRKVKCSGEQPVCAGCRRAGDQCVWPAPSNRTGGSENQVSGADERVRTRDAPRDRPSQTQSSSRRLSDDAASHLAVAQGEAAAAIGAGRRRGRRRPSHASASHSSPTVARSASRHGPGALLGPSPELTAPSPTTPGAFNGSPASNSRVASSGDPSLGASLWYQVGIGEDGTVIYNGPTSRFHAGTLLERDEEEDDEDDERGRQGHQAGDTEDGQGPEEVEAIAREGDAHTASADDQNEAFLSTGPDAAQSRLKARHTETLRSQHALMDSVWMPLIAAKTTMNGTGVDTETGVTLLDIYWNWLHPLHHLVYRPAFLMDLALGGPNVSDFLLLCIFALAARHLPSEGQSTGAQGTAGGSAALGEQYAARAKVLLLDEMNAPAPSIPTIQGLLILGGRQCAMGFSAQGWLYTGMAIRMMQDVGLHLDTTRLAGLIERWTPAETETRKRLYNAAYVWDKTLSLALGRPPSLIRPPYPASEILDVFDNERLWQPVHAKEVAQSFVPCPAYVTSTLNVFCSLHEVTTDMLLLFSTTTGPHAAAQFTEEVSKLDARLRRWYDTLHPALRIEDPSQLAHSPPPHIVSLNLLYHTLHILLRRPFLSSASHSTHRDSVDQCITHSKKIHSIHTLYSGTFPHRLMTYQVSYCIYTAATVEALELKSDSLSPEDRKQAAARLTAAVRILQNEASHTPGSGKSLDTIRRLLTEGGQGQRVRYVKPRQTRQRHRAALGQVRRRRQGSAALLDETMDVDSPGDETSAETPGQQGHDAHGPVQTLPTAAENFTSAAGSGLSIGVAPPVVDTINDNHNSNNNGSNDTTMPSHDNQQQQPGGMVTYENPAVIEPGDGGEDAACWGTNANLGFYGGTNTGAGFHPDSFSWGYGVADNLSFPNNNASASSASSYPVWGNQGSQGGAWSMPGN